MNTVKDKLSRIADELLDMAQEMPEEEARMLRNASYDIENVRTSKAIGELVHVAFRMNGGEGNAEPVALRRRAA